MDKHIRSVLKEVAYVYLKYLIYLMRLGMILSLIMFLLACITMPIKIACILLITAGLWCIGWMVAAKAIINKFKLDRIEYY